jgi:hypothetical protein
MPSGIGYFGGYGNVQRSGYATPAELGAKPWALDFNVEAGWPSYPTDQRVNPNTPPGLLWQTGDWDPGLRHWSLPFDVHLSEWLQDVDLAAPSVLAAREFASHHDEWKAARRAVAWIHRDDRRWQSEWLAINSELEELVDLMQRERAAYLDEAWLQSDNIPLYFIHFLGMDTPSKPWTVELIRCGLSIGNLVYMHYKDHFRRVRPSTLCPGLVPPWGPPRHPAFPSGHAFLGHFIALLLLSIPGVARRYGMFFNAAPKDIKATEFAFEGRKPSLSDMASFLYSEDMRSPLLWLAWRLARNRERIGVHYRSDSSASRSLAANIWAALLEPVDPLMDSPRIEVPTLHKVLQRASAEWS